MKIKLIIFFGFGLIILMTSCNSLEKNTLEIEQVFGSWRLSEIKAFNREDDSQINDALVTIPFVNKKISEGVVFHFFPDSSFTEITNYSIEIGKWEQLGTNQIRLRKNEFIFKDLYSIGSTKMLKAEMIVPHEEVKLGLTYSNDGGLLKDFKEDPFYADNNQWRLPPSKKESNEEIRKRLLNYILHYAYILKATTEREQNVVSFAHSMGLIQVFKGGIGRIPKNKINEEWIKCFYDKEDAMKAFYLFSSYLKRGVYKGGTTGDWIKDDSQILLTLHDKIKNKTMKEKERFSKKVKSK